MPSVAGRAITQRSPRQVFVEVAVVGFFLLPGGAG